MNLVIMGPPGSGKGTISKKLVREFGFTHIAPGDLLREEVEKKTELGQEIEALISKGNLVSDELVTKLIKKAIGKKKKIILDGFPRNPKQAKILKELINIDNFIVLEITEEVAIKRLAGRMICQKCQVPFNLKTVKPKEIGVCDHCGGKLVRRTDEKPETIKRRFQRYLKSTQPVVDYYKQKKVLHVVDGSGTPDEEYNLVKKVIYGC